jgi:hypothetical protein
MGRDRDSGSERRRAARKSRSASRGSDGDPSGLVGSVVFRTVVFACSVQSLAATRDQLAKLRRTDGDEEVRA